MTRVELLAIMSAVLDTDDNLADPVGRAAQLLQSCERLVAEEPDKDAS